MLTAPSEAKPPDKVNRFEDYPQGYYADGAYTAVPIPSLGKGVGDEEEEDIDPQETYYASLLANFLALSQKFQSTPPASTVTESVRMEAAQIASAPPSKWRYNILYTPPKITVLSQMDQDTVMTGLSALEKNLTWKNLEKGKYLGAWAWALLGRCREVGMMGSEEVGVLRDLGKKASALIRGLMAGLGFRTGKEEAEEGGREDEDMGDEDEAKGDMEEEADEDAVEGAVDWSDGEVDSDIDKIECEEAPLGSNAIEARQTIPPKPIQYPPNEATDTTTEIHPIQENSDPLSAIDETATFQEVQARLLNKIQTLSPLPNPSPSPNNSEDGHHLAPHLLSSVPIMGEDQEEGDDIDVPTRITATLDMIITVVGEAYGQRDLLVGRMVWD